MKRHIPFFFTTTLLLLLWNIPALLFAGGSDWEKVKDKNGIRVYTRTVDGSNLKDFRAVMIVPNTNVEAVKQLILDIPNYPTWMHNCSKGRVLKETSPNQRYIHTITHTPWPVTDRDVVLSITDRTDGDNIVTIDLLAASNQLAEQENMVRIKVLKGYWKITPKNNGVEVIYEIHTDPAGNIPDWLANAAVVETPYKTFLGMKSKLTN